MAFDITNAGSGAASGASAGSAFGWPGALIGGVGGGLIGGFSGGGDETRGYEGMHRQRDRDARTSVDTLNALGDRPFMPTTAGYAPMGMGGFDWFNDVLEEGRGGYTSAMSAPDVANNPYVQNMLQSLQTNMGQNFQEQILPGLRLNAVGNNSLGSSRQGIAEGLAAQRAQQAYGDSANRLLLDSYGKGLQSQSSALSQTGNLANLGLTQDRMMQQNSQGMMNADAARRAEEYSQPWQNAMNRQNSLNSMMSGQPANYQGNQGNQAAANVASATTLAGIGKDIYDNWGQRGGANSETNLGFGNNNNFGGVSNPFSYDSFEFGN